MTSKKAKAKDTVTPTPLPDDVRKLAREAGAALAGIDSAFASSDKANKAVVVALAKLSRELNNVIRAQLTEDYAAGGHYKEGDKSSGGSISGIVSNVIRTALAMRKTKVPMNDLGFDKLARKTKTTVKLSQMAKKIEPDGTVNPNKGVSPTGTKVAKPQVGSAITESLTPEDKKVIKDVAKGTEDATIDAIVKLLDRLSIKGLTNVAAIATSRAQAKKNPQAASSAS